MAKLSLSEVSNRFNVSRSTLYRAIKEGRISRGADGLFDVVEVIRCFGEPIKKHEPNQVTTSPKDDADLRQLVDFMRKEIESYKDREKRYLDQIDRFQLLLGHKEPEDKMSHDTPVRQTNETPCNDTNETKKDFDNKGILEKIVSHDASMKQTSSTHWNDSMKRDETAQKRSLFSRVLNAIISDE